MKYSFYINNYKYDSVKLGDDKFNVVNISGFRGALVLMWL